MQFYFFQVATRLAYGVALEKLGRNNSRVIALDGDTKNSTFSDKFRVSYQDVQKKCSISRTDDKLLVL